MNRSQFSVLSSYWIVRGLFFAGSSSMPSVESESWCNWRRWRFSVRGWASIIWWPRVWRLRWP